MHGTANNSLRVDYFRNQYHRVLLGGCTILHGITNYSLGVETSNTGYTGLLLGGGTILPGIANSSPRRDCFRNQYHRVRRVTARWAYDLHGITNYSLRIDTIIARYARLLLGGRTILDGITNNSLRVDTSITGSC